MAENKSPYEDFLNDLKKNLEEDLRPEWLYS